MTINLDIKIDATDQLEKAEGTAVSMGIYLQLSALEMLIYPKRSLVSRNTTLDIGTIEIIQSMAHEPYLSGYFKPTSS